MTVRRDIRPKTEGIERETERKGGTEGRNGERDREEG
jgi:hypothetical protein